MFEYVLGLNCLRFLFDCVCVCLRASFLIHKITLLQICPHLLETLQESPSYVQAYIFRIFHTFVAMAVHDETKTLPNTMFVFS